MSLEITHKQVFASYAGVEMPLTLTHIAFSQQAQIDYMMGFFPVPPLPRKLTKRGRLRWQGKMRARERIRRFYDPSYSSSGVFSVPAN